MMFNTATPPPRNNGHAAGAGSLPALAAADQAHVWLATAIQWASERGATDLHLFPAEGEGLLWVRVDGELREAARYPAAAHQRMIARLKVLGRCADYTGELVQEGRFSLDARGDAGEVRLSILPTLRGEKAVLRLLGGGRALRKLGELGLDDDLQSALRRAADRPQGLILAIGPSGSGKSTALYAMLDDLAARAGGPVSILTIEDPIESPLPFAAQISADPARGLGFAEGLRALLRQDPEVIMIGEVRDAATAETALQAALTGHRLLSTMHALTPAEALIRLRQMGCPAYGIASALAGLLNIRLARLICPECRTLRAPDAAELARLGADVAQVGEAAGCPACLGSGRRGRSAIGEWVTPGPACAEALQANAPAPALAATLERQVGARPAMLRMITEGLAPVGEIERLWGLHLAMEGN